LKKRPQKSGSLHRSSLLQLKGVGLEAAAMLVAWGRSWLNGKLQFLGMERQCRIQRAIIRIWLTRSDMPVLRSRKDCSPGASASLASA